MNLHSSIAPTTIPLSLSSNTENIKAYSIFFLILSFYSSVFGTTLALKSSFLLKFPYTSAETDPLYPATFIFLTGFFILNNLKYILIIWIFNNLITFCLNFFHFFFVIIIIFFLFLITVMFFFVMFLFFMIIIRTMFWLYRDSWSLFWY